MDVAAFTSTGSYVTLIPADDDPSRMLVGLSNTLTGALPAVAPEAPTRIADGPSVTTTPNNTVAGLWEDLKPLGASVTTTSTTTTPDDEPRRTPIGRSGV